MERNTIKLQYEQKRGNLLSKYWGASQKKMKSPDTLFPLFILGCYRSGTTLLRRILNIHSNIYISKETSFLLYMNRNLKQILSNKEIFVYFENIILKSLKNEKWEKIPTYKDFINSDYEKSLRGIYQFVCLFEKPKNKKKLLYWGDNTPRYIYIVPLLFEAFPDARFIHIIRDPRDVVASVKNLHFGGHTAFVIAMEWMERVSLALLAKELVGSDRFLTIKFEDLILNWKKCFNEIAKFLKVDNSFSCLPNDIESLRIAFSLPHHKKLAEPFDKKVIGKYKKILNNDEIKIIESLTYSFLKVFGYDSSGFNLPSTCLESYHKISIEYAKNCFFRYIMKTKKFFTKFLNLYL